MNESTTNHFEVFRLRRLMDPITVFGKELDGWVWLIPLGLLFFIAVVYVIVMYIRDSKSLHPALAVFLAGLRITVYVLLALAFLLPSWQSIDETTLRSKVLVVVDFTLSMHNKDDLPSAQMPVESLPTRLDKVVDLFTRERLNAKTQKRTNFLQDLLEKNPVTFYRFGSQIDEQFVVFAHDAQGQGRFWTAEEWSKREASSPGKSCGAPEWEAWLAPDLRKQEGDSEALAKLKQHYKNISESTNVGGSIQDVLKREGNNMLQGVVVVTDGRSTDYRPEVFRELQRDAKLKNVPIFAVKVGEDRPKIEIEIADVTVPPSARPDDHFPVSVKLRARGLDAQEWPVTLYVYAPNPADKDKPNVTLDPRTLTKENAYRKLEAKVNFQPQGDSGHLGGEATFEISPAELGEAPEAAPSKPGEKAGASNQDLRAKLLREGKWYFVARVPKHPHEIFIPEEHVSEPSPVEILQRPLRILLFTQGPMRDYQFLRTLLVREKDKDRVDLSIYMQPPPGVKEVRPGVVADVDPDRLLTHFPDMRVAENSPEDNKETHWYNLTNYDLIVAFDPDWTQLTEPQMVKLNKWVDGGGGLILVGGDVNTVELARPGIDKTPLKNIADLYPVTLKDNRIQTLERETKEPHRLIFDPKMFSADMEFLNLEEPKQAAGGTINEEYLLGWEDFFTGKPRATADDLNKEPQRGIYNFYPVTSAKRGAKVIATFSDKFGHLDDGSYCPYLVVNPIFGKGRTAWLGSGETWRLRGYKEAFFERFWTKLCRWAGSGSQGKQNSRIIPYIPKRFKARQEGHIEVQIRGKDQEPLSQEAKPRLTIIPPEGSGEKPREYTLSAKRTDTWRGWFAADFEVGPAGTGYKYRLKVEETGEGAEGSFDVQESNPELDNTAPDVKTLYFDLASDAKPVFDRITDQATVKELRDRLQRMSAVDTKKDKAADKKAAEEPEYRLYFDLNNADLIPRCMTDDSRTQQNQGGFTEVWTGKFDLWGMELSWTLLLVVFLLCLEWLTRKLVRLA